MSAPLVANSPTHPHHDGNYATRPVDNASGAYNNRTGGFGGHSDDRSQLPFDHHRRFANPAPLGLLSFATTTLILSMYNARVRHVSVPNIVIGSALAYGGLCQLLAGMWEFAHGNTFGATVFSSYAGFWISYAIILWPSSGAIASYGGDGDMLSNAIGIFLVAWFIVTFLFLVASTKSSVGLVVFFFLLDMTFLLLFIGEFKGSRSLTKAGGWFGIMTAFVAYYVGLAGMLSPTTSHFTLPVKSLAGRDHNVRDTKQ